MFVTGMPRELCVVDYWWGRKLKEFDITERSYIL